MMDRGRKPSLMDSAVEYRNVAADRDELVNNFRSDDAGATDD